LPFVRGRILPETENTGRAKRVLDVLLSVGKLDESTLTSLDELEQLRVYLAAFIPPVCSIRILVPVDQVEVLGALQQFGIEAVAIELATTTERVPKKVADRLTDPLLGLLATALRHDVDCIVTNDPNLLPYAEEFTEAGTLLTSPDFLLRYAEVFVRGHDLPWAFGYMVWFEPWMSFYPLSEGWTFRSAMEFLTHCQSKGVNRDAIELCRSLAYNRLGADSRRVSGWHHARERSWENRLGAGCWERNR
jgi:hypothetical protein